MESEFGPGRLTAEWMDAGAPGESPWILETSNPYDPGHVDAFLGNGFMGQRIGVLGDASSYGEGGTHITPSGCLVHGLWDESGLVPPPRWALLGYSDGGSALEVQAGRLENYRQRLDMQRAILQTSFVWSSGTRRTRIDSRFYVCRSRPNLGVLDRTIVPEFDGQVTFIDGIDGRFIEDARDWRISAPDTLDTALSMELCMGPRRRRLGVASLVQVEPVCETRCSAVEQAQCAERRISFEVSSGRSYTVRKIVAVVTDHDAPNPRAFARILAHGAALDPAGLEQEHVRAWALLWEHRIEVPHARLQTLINASLYQLYSHLREGARWSPGPTGLSANAWQGRVFWDSDLWMYPPLCLLNPALARGLVEYRWDTLEGAQRNARAEGHEGTMWAWESAEFGDEIIPHLVFHHQHHVSSDVALAQWWYYLVSGDTDCLVHKAGPTIVESARFWVSWAEYNREQDRYEIRRVCCADEYAGIRDNNAYTNYSAMKTIRLAQRVSALIGIETPPEWEDVAAKMWIPFDHANRRYVEYEGYKGETVKQADTALLVYPYEMPMPDDVKANVVDYYRTRYPKGNIMMAAAFDGIVDCELGRAGGGWESLLKLLPHFRLPYLLASESPLNQCISFATGLGGLLQLVLMGFAGIRMHEGELVAHPCLPESIDWILARRMCYGGVTFDLAVSRDGARIDKADGTLAFQLNPSPAPLARPGSSPGLSPSER